MAVEEPEAEVVASRVVRRGRGEPEGRLGRAPRDQEVGPVGDVRPIPQPVHRGAALEEERGVPRLLIAGLEMSDERRPLRRLARPGLQDERSDVAQVAGPRRFLQRPRRPVDVPVGQRCLNIPGYPQRQRVLAEHLEDGACVLEQRDGLGRLALLEVRDGEGEDVGDRRLPPEDAPAQRRRAGLPVRVVGAGRGPRDRAVIGRVGREHLPAVGGRLLGPSRIVRQAGQAPRLSHRALLPVRLADECRERVRRPAQAGHALVVALDERPIRGLGPRHDPTRQGGRRQRAPIVDGRRGVADRRPARLEFQRPRYGEPG